MASTFYHSSNSAFKGMAPPQQPPSPPSQPSDVSMSSARVRLSYQYDSFEGGPSPQHHEGQQQHHHQQQQQHVPHQPATVGTTANNESTNAANDDGWAAHYDEEIRLRREELARLQEGNKASLHLLENKARSELSPAFSPSVQQFVANVMARDSATSSFAVPLSGRTPLGPDNGGDFLQTPRTAGGGATNPSSSLLTKGALGFIKDEAVRLRGKRRTPTSLGVGERGRGRKKRELGFADVRLLLLLSQNLLTHPTSIHPTPFPSPAAPTTQSIWSNKPACSRARSSTMTNSRMSCEIWPENGRVCGKSWRLGNDK